MANQLQIPTKATSEIPLTSIKDAFAAYVQNNYNDTHPDEFEPDIKLWDDLRRSCLSKDMHLSKTHAAIRYHAHLTFMLTKIPSDIGLEFSYSSAFRSSAPWIAIPNLHYERACLLFNLAALYSQLALAEDRTHAEGIKRANAFYQNAAGTLSYLISSALPPLLQSLDEKTRVDELSEQLLRSLEYLMLAQAQECAWQRAVIDRLKNGAIAKLSSKVSTYYRMCGTGIREAPSFVKQAFPQEWLAHVETKQLHFEAAAQYRKSIDDLETNKYGHELTRLLEAKALAKRGYDVARKSYVSKPVLDDIKSLLSMVETNINRAERDNDLIYHQVVPPIATVPVIQEASLVKSTVPAGLGDPKSVLGSDPVIFGELIGWGARVAVDIYHDRRESWLKEDIQGRVSALDLILDRTLQELSLPASLDALDRPVGLPPSLLKKAEEVRIEDGPSRIDGSLENVDLLADKCRAVLDEAMDILDQEASEDEGLRKSYAGERLPLERLPSYEANVELSSKEARYRQMLEQAGGSDEQVRSKWNEWEGPITRLTWDENEIERWVPSSTVPTSTSGKGKSSSPVNSSTLTNARELRVLLDALEDNRQARAQLSLRAQRAVEADDIRAKIMQEAAGFERWTSVEPAMFEETLDREMSKFDTYKDGIEEGAGKQVELLEQLRAKHEQFLQSRREDRSIKDRERALQSLDLAYHKYREITRNLDEGLKFYNDLHGILHKFRYACKEWVRMRRDEMRQLTQDPGIRASGAERGGGALEDLPTPKATSPAFQRTKHSSSHSHFPSSEQLYIDTDTVDSPVPNAPAPAPPALNLPPPTSDEWESTPTPLPNPVGGGKALASTSKPSGKIFTNAKPKQRRAVDNYN